MRETTILCQPGLPSSADLLQNLDLDLTISRTFNITPCNVLATNVLSSL